MAPGDIIEIAVCIVNLNGLVDVNKFEWEKETIIKINKNDKDVMCYNRDIKILQNKGDRKTKVLCDTNRICELEDAVPEWIKLNATERDIPYLPIDTSIYT